jgi:hypothetical protein
MTSKSTCQWFDIVIYWKHDSVITATSWDQEVNYQSAPELNYWNVQLCSKHISSCRAFGRCCVEAIHCNKRVLGVVMWEHWLKLTLSSYMSLAFIPLRHNDIITSRKSFIPFDSDRGSTTACHKMGASLLLGWRGQQAHVIPSFLLNIRLV